MDKKQATAICKAIFRYLDKYNAGSYPNYGWDWPTLRVLFPQIARTLKECHRVINEAGSNA